MKKSAALLFLLISFNITAFCGRIIYPWRATTAIVKSGESFEVWFNADPGQTVSSAQLNGPYNTIVAPIKINTGNWIYDVTSQNTYNTKITVKVPKSAPADRYDIVLNTSTGMVESQAGVKVIKEYKSNYYILHFSDIHAFQNGYATTLNRLSNIINIANIINPEIVFNTGDNLYRPTEERMNQLFSGNNPKGHKGLNQLNAAVFSVAGNHDIDFDKIPEEGFYKEKSDWWNNWWGLQAYHFSYGNGRFMVINNGWNGFNPAQQITEIQSWLQEAGTGNFRLGAAHIRNKEMLPFDSIANLELVLIGHNHNIANQNPTPLKNKPIQYIVNSVRDHMEFNLFKVNDKTGESTPVSGPTAQVVYVENPDDSKTPALYRPKLRLTYAETNDGSFATNSATIVNNFDFAIEGARVRFVMPLGRKYKVTNGKVEQAFVGASVHVVDVLIDLKPNSTTQIKIL
ncbi:MAG: metallophosphoesterase [Prolixibacteraceae bacterium]|nr:metallophosphoesterase [Prolixibacteraceae bacterium]